MTALYRPWRTCPQRRRRRLKRMVHGPGGLKPVHSFDQVRFRGFEHEMKVVAHQYISMDAPAGPLASLPESRQKGPAVLVVSVNGFPPIPAVKNEIDGSGEFDARFTRPRGRS